MLHYDAAEALHNAFEHLFSPFVPHKKMFALYLLTSLGLAWFVWRTQKQEDRQARHFFSYMFSADIYAHRSSWQDVGMFLGNGLVYFLIIDQFLPSEKFVSAMVQQGLLSLFGPREVPALKGMAGVALLTVVIALLFDLSVYCAHYLLHKVPMLWVFHKVHHSAEVMTPLTLLREHPVELVLNALMFAAFVGSGIGIFSYLSMQRMADSHVLGVNAIIFVSLLMGVHLRHTHVWLHYPAWLSRFLISPAQHQIHHSTARRHFDKNLGLTFPFWDKLFGTLYVPKEREDIEFGILKRERNPYASVKAMYVQPFRESYALFRTSSMRKK